MAPNLGVYDLTLVLLPLSLLPLRAAVMPWRLLIGCVWIAPVLWACGVQWAPVASLGAMFVAVCVGANGFARPRRFEAPARVP